MSIRCVGLGPAPLPITSTITALLLVPALAALAVGQRVDTAPPPPSPPPSPRHDSTQARASAERYERVFDELRNMAPRTDRVATVRNLILRRDVIEFRLADGKLYLATPVAGRTVGAVFVGHGSVSFAPPLEMERAQLKQVLGDSVLAAPISAAAFVFVDSTLAELERQLTFGAATGEASGPLHDALDRLLDEGRRTAEQPTLMTALLNGEGNGFFYAHAKREQGEDLMFVVDPQQDEQIELLRGGRYGQKVQIVSQFKRGEDLRDSTAVGGARHDPLRLDGYRIDATIANGLGFSATATVRVTAQRDGVRWARFLLFSQLAVDSLQDDAGTADSFYRTKKSEELWVRFDAPLHAGDTRSVRVVYHGDLIEYVSVLGQLKREVRDERLNERLGVNDQWFVIKTSQTWFPRYGPANGRYADWPAASMELTFHTPRKYRFASVGRLVESRVEGDVLTTRWVTERPAGQVCFNLGTFEEFKITDPRIPPVIVQINREAHLQLQKLVLGQSDPMRDVGSDVANSLAFFTRVYGPPLFGRYYATEIPFFYGQAFPGLMYLSMETFQTMNESGREEAFRAHEMAHQWWGIGVEPAGYRDTWLSEGFAEFSALWYMQLILMDNEKFFKQLKTRRTAIRARRDDAPPIGLGWRVAQMNDGRDYFLVIYQKGAWVLHMLRNLMIDLHTMKEDAFTAMMRDFYLQYRGRPASTQDFQRVVEHHVGLPMDWFFNEWVYGTSIPTYVLSWRAEPAPDRGYLLHLRVRQEDVPKEFVMPVPLQIEFADGGHAVVRVNVSGPLTEGELHVPGEPKRLELNPLESVLANVKEEGWH